MKNKFIIITALIVIILNNPFLHSETGAIDTVLYYLQGDAESEYLNNPNFPENIYGVPSISASRNIPANALTDIEAIGIGGEIVVGFKGKVLINGPGTDFIIFENAFVNPVNKGIFAEPGIVSVSQDGINFKEFPFDAETLLGLAGLEPVYGDKDPFNPEVSGGDKFDLSLLDLDYIRYIKIKDTSEIIKYLPQGHKYKNPDFLLTGFDLDAVVALHLEDESILSVNESAEKNNLMVYGDILYLGDLKHHSQGFRIFDLYGRVLMNGAVDSEVILLDNLSISCYFIEIIYESGNKIFKFVKQ